jgi:hypothetical protein
MVTNVRKRRILTKHGLISWWTLNFEGTLGSDCSRLGIKVSNSTGDVESHGEIRLCFLLILHNFSLLFMLNFQALTQKLLPTD